MITVNRRPGDDSRTILHLAQSSEGGVARVVADLVAGQRARGDRVVVACVPGSRLFRTTVQVGAEALDWEAGRAPGPALAREVAGVRRIVRSVGPDLVHLHSSKAGLAGRIALRGRLPTVFQPHAWSFDAVNGPVRRASMQWERAGTRWVHQLVCVSEAERAQGEAAGVRARYAVVHNGVDLGYFAAADCSREAARSRLGIDGSAPLAVCVGRLCHQKGQDVLLGVWPAIRAGVPGAQLVLVGDGPDHAALEARAPAAVRFVGDVADPRDWYLAADLVVLPSRWEGMALAPLEAMACSCAVVVTDVPGARESLPAGQVRAALVPPEDPGALAAAVTARLADRHACHLLGRQAHAHVCRHHDVSRVVERMYAVYDDARRVWVTGR